MGGVQEGWEHEGKERLRWGIDVEVQPLKDILIEVAIVSKN